MSERRELPEEKTLRVAEQVFDALMSEASLGSLMEHAETVAGASLRRLYIYVTGVRADDPDLEAALAEEPALRTDLRRLTEKVAGFHIPKLAAAASGPITQRGASGCNIRLDQSRAEPAQTYVIISLDDPGSHPRWLAVFFDDDRCRRIALPEPQDGLIQLLVESDSELVAALRNPESEIFIDG